MLAVHLLHSNLELSPDFRVTAQMIGEQARESVFMKDSYCFHTQDRHHGLDMFL
jgi:hypothetical protein